MRRDASAQLAGIAASVEARKLRSGRASHLLLRIRRPDAPAAPTLSACHGHVYEFEVEREGGRRRTGGRHHGSLTAPMPATVRRIEVTVGQRVERGDTLILLEAMKMELPVKAPAAGSVQSIHCHEGDLVQPGAPLIELDGVG
jgi:biotin carboxyl carrier protein